jgi:hypothetical protein
MQSLHLLLQNVLLSGKSQNFVVNNRRKKQCAAAHLVLQPAYSKKLPIEDKQKNGVKYLLRKITFTNFMLLLWVPILTMFILFKVLFVNFYFVSSLIMTIM